MKNEGRRGTRRRTPVFFVRRVALWRCHGEKRGSRAIYETNKTCVSELSAKSILQKGGILVEIDPRDRDKTTFTSHFGTYRFVRMPFGLRNAPATFQRAVDVILAGIKWQHCLVYLDDVIVFSNSVERHMVHVDHVLTLLRSAGVSLKLKKCNFFTQSVSYLGHVIRPGRLSLADKNTRALREAKHPSTQTELRSFLGICNVYRRFVPNFARIAAPLNRMLKKGEPKDIDTLLPEQADAFEALKTALLNPPILALPRREGHFTLDTDASEHQVGCCLMQEQPNGDRLPVGYWSRSLNDAERNYSTTEKECLAVVWAVLLLRPYLEGVQFTVRTDHHSLRWVLAGTRTESHGRLERWRLRLLEFDFEVQYRPGIVHQAADALSRLPTDAEDTDPVEDDIPTLAVESTCALTPTPSRRDQLAQQANMSPITREEFVDEQERDEMCQEFRRTGGRQFDFDPSGILVRISPLDGKRQIVVPRSLQPRVLRLAHYPVLAGHPGGCRMYHTLRQTYYWPAMAHDAYATVRECSDCARNRVKERSKTSFLKLFPAAAPLEFVCMDILGPLPRTARHNRFLLVLTDRFSKLTRTVPLTNVSTPTVAKAFCEHWVFAYGPPVYLLTDNGSQFASKFFVDVCTILGIKQLFTTTYHPQTNGQAERFNRTLLQALRNYVAEHQRNWDQFSSAITFGYNCQVHRTTGIPPFELVLSRPPVSLSLQNIPTWDGNAGTVRHDFLRKLTVLMDSARASMAKAQQRYKLNYDRSVRETNNNLPLGSWVFVRIEEFPTGRSKKLHPQAHGPYQVVQHDGRTFLLTNGRETFRISSDRIVRAPTPPGAVPLEDPPPRGDSPPSAMSPAEPVTDLPSVGDIDTHEASREGAGDRDHPFAEFDWGPVDSRGTPMRLTRAAARRAAEGSPQPEDLTPRPGRAASVFGL